MFEDAFDSGISPEWTIGSAGCESSTGSWSASSGELCGQVHGYEECTSAVVGDPNWVNYALSFDVTLVEGLDRIAGIHYVDFTHQLHLNMNSWLGKVVMVAGSGDIIFESPYPLELGVTYHVRFGIFGTEAGIQIDGVNVGGVDVSPWITDGTIPASGKIALQSYSGGLVNTNHTCYDNVVVESLSAVKSDDTSWGALKARY